MSNHRQDAPEPLCDLTHLSNTELDLVNNRCLLLRLATRTLLQCNYPNMWFSKVDSTRSHINLDTQGPRKAGDGEIKWGNEKGVIRTIILPPIPPQLPGTLWFPSLHASRYPPSPNPPQGNTILWVIMRFCPAAVVYHSLARYYIHF